ncbi:MAG: AAA family ATPase [Acetobacteraceae bacterium]
MIHSIEVNGYRTFPNFAMEGLGRINLFVGKNNTGKTSLLEALSLLWAGGILPRFGIHWPVAESRLCPTLSSAAG